MSTILTILSVLLGVPLATGIFLRSHRRSLEASGRKETDIYLLKSPNRFATLDIVYLILRLLTKYVLSTLKLTATLKPARSAPQAFELPRIQAHGLLNVTQTDIERFHVAVRDTESPSTGHRANIFLLPALTGSLVIYLLTLSACPIKPLGAVNTRNRITSFSRSAQDADALMLASGASRLSYTATFGPAHGRRVKRGIEFEIHIDVFLERAEDNVKKRIMTQVLAFLQFLPKKALPHFAGHVEQKPEMHDIGNESLSSVPIKIGKDAPRKWAACNKDFNPIHISSIGAKAFGQKSVIAHGMHTVALALQSIRDSGSEENGMVEAKDICWSSADEWKRWTLDMQFLRPANLPANVVLRATPATSPEVAELWILTSGKVLTWIRCRSDK